MLLKNLQKRNAISCPDWLPDNTHFLCQMGSVAYGCSTDHSDMDIYGFCIPRKEVIFRHLAGEIEGFGTKKERFWQWEQQHVADPDGKQRSYDFTIFNIVKYFQLCMENNPNALDSLFVPVDCILHITAVGNIVRENRRQFLHKGSWYKLKGYSFAQLSKVGKVAEKPEIIKIRAFEKGHNIPHLITLKNLEDELKHRGTQPNLKLLNNGELQEYYSLFKEGMSQSGRFEQQKIHDTDLKFLYHVVRLLYEAEMILKECDLDLRRHSEHLKAIRRGEVSQQQVQQWFQEKELYLEKLYQESTIPHSPDEQKIKNILLNCLEHHYGSLSKTDIVIGDKNLDILKQIKKLINSANI